MWAKSQNFFKILAAIPCALGAGGAILMPYHRTSGNELESKMITTHKLTKVLKVVEFANAAQAFSTMERGTEAYDRFIDFIQSQTQAKQNKFWAYVDAQNANA